MEIRKLGALGALAAMLLAFGVFGLTAGPASAIPGGGVVVTPATVAAPTGVASVTAAYVDDTGAATPAVLTAVDSDALVNVGDFFVVCMNAETTGVIANAADTDTCTVAEDADSTADAQTLTSNFQCLAAGTVTFTLTHGGVSSTTGTLTCTAAAGVDPSSAVESATVSCGPNPTLEIMPAPDPLVGLPNGSILVCTVTVEDGDGEPVAGAEVIAIAATGAIGSEADIVENANGTCRISGDTTPLQEEIISDADGEATFEYCATSSAALGATTLNFIVHRNLDPARLDIFLSQAVTIVGPPASLTITSSPSSLICGEKAAFSGTVRDAIGQNVSPGTPVEIVTNFGGVTATGNSGGTLAVSASTVAGGNFSGFLLTSTTHVGPYEVVASVTGANGQPIFAQTTVTCTMAAAAAPTAAATVRPPSTGTGSITPPNTGDAGLASESSSWTLFSVAGLVAFAIAGLATVKFARR